MKTFKNKIFYILVSMVMSTTVGLAQVSIGHSAPEGMLDLQNSDNYGFVFPKTALTSSVVAAPVTNPNGGVLEIGTVVFNTATTTTGANDVSPGIYAWDGSEWNPQYLREDSAFFEQSTLNFRTVTGDETYNSPTSDWAFVPGLETTSFTPKYTGTYRIKTAFNFGAGKVILPDLTSTPSAVITMATMEGLFRFTFDGTSQIIYTHAYSLYNNGVFYDQFKHDTSVIQYVHLTAGQTYNFSLEIDVFVADHLENNGNSGDGRGYVGIGTPCSVEFSFIN
ncbi:hypothetical protein ACFQO1_02645 [Jejudonia soesokkakensis]|uniref:Uncharacterized protein n=1 Tax=Jejudonia soesokkakensis TaxID=1323432 RepID=A0ABW2MNU7_9FLAO